MIRSRIIFRQLVVDLYAFAIFHCLLSYALYVAYVDNAYTFLALAAAVPFFLMSAVRLRVGNILIFLALHLVLTLWPLVLLPNGYARYIVLAAMAAAAVYSFAAKLKARILNKACVVTIIVMNLTIMLHLSSMYPDSGMLRTVLTLWVFVSFVCYLLFIQTARVDDSIKILSGATRQPVATMLRFNNMTLAAFLAIVLFMAALSPLLPVGIVFEGARQLILIFLRWLYSKYGSFTDESVGKNALLGSNQGGEDITFKAGESNESEFLIFLDRIINQVAWIAFALGIAALAVFGAYLVYKRFKATARADGDTREFVGPDLKIGAVGELWRGLKVRMPYFGKDENEKIRRAYYKKVRGHIKRGVSVEKSDTAGSIAEKVKPKEDISTITKQYNGARYGGG